MTRANNNAPRPWTAADDQLLLDWAHCKFSTAVIAEKLARTEAAIRGRLATLAKHGTAVKRARANAWLPEHDVQLRALVGEGKSTPDIAFTMGRAESCINRHKHLLGLMPAPAGDVSYVMRPNGVAARAATPLAEHGAMTLTRLSVLVGRSAKILVHALGSAVSAGLLCRDTVKPFQKSTYWVPGRPPQAAPAEVLPAGGDFSFAAYHIPGVVSEFPPLSTATLSQIATASTLRDRLARRV